MSEILSYTKAETENIQNNKSTQLAHIVVDARLLAKHLKPVKWGEDSNGLQIIEEIIVRGYCTIYMAHLEESDFEEMLTNTLAYFRTGLYDCEKISTVNGKYYYVAGWRYTDDTHTTMPDIGLTFTLLKKSMTLKSA